MTRVSVPVEVLLWVEVEDGTDDEVSERAWKRLREAIPGADGAGTRDGRLFRGDPDAVITWATVIGPDLDNVVIDGESSALPP